MKTECKLALFIAVWTALTFPWGFLLRDVAPQISIFAQDETKTKQQLHSHDEYERKFDIFGLKGKKYGKVVAPFVPTPLYAVQMAIKLANVHEGDVVYELGAGDSRYAIEAARRHRSIRCVAVENDFSRVELSRDLVKKAGVTDQVHVLYADLLQIDFSNASVVFFFLVPQAILELRSKLEKIILNNGRVVSMSFKIPGFVPTNKSRVFVNYVAQGFEEWIYLYTNNSIS